MLDPLTRNQATIPSNDSPRPTEPDIRPLPFSPPLVPEDAIEAVVRSLRSGWLGTGPLTAEFEQKFADYVGATSAAAVSSCTSGLFLTLKALGIGPGDEVITTAMTFCSTINSILHVGAKPVLVDVDMESKNLDLAEVSRVVTERTKAVLAVHYAGYPIDGVTLRKFCDEHGLYLVEDCAHAIETLWSGKHAGTYGHAGVFSFYATKNLAIGEGGMVVSNDAQLTERVASLSLHGLSRGAWERFSVSGRKTYDIVALGYKANMTDVQSAIGISQLALLEAWLPRRNQIWGYYVDMLQGFDIELPNLPTAPGSRHALHLFTIGLPTRIERDNFLERVATHRGVSLGLHYKAIPDFQFYQTELELSPESFPVAVSWGRKCVSLSISPRMTDEDVERVASGVVWGLQ